MGAFKYTDALEPWAALATAICKQACEDYMLYQYFIKTDPMLNNVNLEEWKKTVKGCLAYFRGELFKTTIDLDAEELIKTLDKEVMSCAEQGHPPRAYPTTMYYQQRQIQRQV